VVGTDVARFTEAKALQDGTLYVEVPDSETSMHLSMQRQRFLDVYRGRFAIKEVREIRFRVGRRQPPPIETPPPPSTADPVEVAQLARELGRLELPDTLAGPAMRAARAMLEDRARKRALGWRACRHCGTLTDNRGADDDPVCDSCRRYTRDPKVHQAARTLAVDPDADTPLIAEDERSVAVYQAITYLDAFLLELLPQVLSDPKYRIQLASAARCLLALRLGKPVADVDHDDDVHLDPRIVQALGRWRS
jgi:hypothetical protein